MRTYFDAALVYSDPTWIDFLQEYSVPEDLIPRFLHVGYVINDAIHGRPPKMVRQELGVKEDETLVILGAGGGKDAEAVFQMGIAAWCHVEPKLAKGAHLLIIGGPYIRPHQWDAIIQQTHDLPSVRAVHHVPFHLEYVRAADLFVGACGYNTFTEVVATQTPAIFIPRQHVDSDEQSVRATQLQSKGKWQVVQIGAQAHTQLVSAMLSALGETRPAQQDEIRLDGARCAAEWIAQWHANRTPI